MQTDTTMAMPSSALGEGPGRTSALPSWLAGTPASGFLAALGMAALDVVMPLWATRDLGVTATERASPRSLRFPGVVAGVVVPGAVSDRFGQRRRTMALLLAPGAANARLGANLGMIT